MSNLAVTFLSIAILALVVALIGHSNSIVNGLGKALFGVFLILFFVDRFFGTENA